MTTFKRISKIVGKVSKAIEDLRKESFEKLYGAKKATFVICYKIMW